MQCSRAYYFGAGDQAAVTTATSEAGNQQASATLQPVLPPIDALPPAPGADDDQRLLNWLDNFDKVFFKKIGD